MFLSPCQSSGRWFWELCVPAKLGNVASQGVKEGRNYGGEENHMAALRKFLLFNIFRLTGIHFKRKKKSNCKKTPDNIPTTRNSTQMVPKNQNQGFS